MTLTSTRPQTTADHLSLLESHAVYILREVAAECERPVLLFSGGKDSAVLLHLAVKAFAPGRLPFPVMHVDTGQNFPEVLAFRDQTVARLNARLVIASVQEAIDRGRVADPGPHGARNRLQTVALLDAIVEHGFDAAFGAPAATRTRPAPKSGSSRFATRSASGTRVSSVPSCGSFTRAG